MAPSPIAKLSTTEQRQLLDDLNYLNTAEIKSFCRRHEIPYAITIEARDGSRKAIRNHDRKGVMLNRLRHFLRTGVVLEETCFRATVVCLEPQPKALTAADRLYFGRYDKKSRSMIALLKALTDGQFRHGAIARMLATEFWTRGEAPTFGEFASAWLQAVREHTSPNPEWAFLSDRANKGDIPDWKAARASRASRVLELLQRISLQRRTGTKSAQTGYRASR